MKHVGVREFRDRATHYLSSGEVLSIERHGQPLGFYIPVRRVDAEEARLALARLRETVQSVLEESGVTEAELSAALTLTRPARDAAGR